MSSGKTCEKKSPLTEMDMMVVLVVLVVVVVVVVVATRTIRREPAEDVLVETWHHLMHK